MGPAVGFRRLREQGSDPPTADSQTAAAKDQSSTLSKRWALRGAVARPIAAGSLNPRASPCTSGQAPLPFQVCPANFPRVRPGVTLREFFAVGGGVRAQAATEEGGALTIAS